VVRLTLLASRLPIQPAGEAEPGWRDAAGGVASVLRIVARSHPCAWIGSAPQGPRPDLPTRWQGTHIVPVDPPPVPVESDRNAFATEVLWPLYHGMPPERRPTDRLWWAYRETNRAFAEAARHAPAGATFWVHDYQLHLVPDLLRRRQPAARIGCCLYTPFPDPDAFTALPQWRAILDGVLGADLVGLQTDTDRDNFLSVAGRAYRVRCGTVEVAGRRVRVGAFPCSIDAGPVEELARRSETARQAARLRAELGGPRILISSAERLDYTKGIDLRLVALRRLFRQRELTVGEVAVLQVAEPSRVGVARYQAITDQVGRLVDEINAEFPPGPVAYFRRHFDAPAMSALYRATDIMVVTPPRDGMNLVAKEYVASRFDGLGALVLSRSAGAARELTDAYIVDPLESGSMERGIMAAVRHLDHSRQRMIRMREIVTRQDARNWMESFLRELGSLPE
jgi:trehalose 6-phosphate synthase